MRNWYHRYSISYLVERARNTVRLTSLSASSLLVPVRLSSSSASRGLAASSSSASRVTRGLAALILILIQRLVEIGARAKALRSSRALAEQLTEAGACVITIREPPAVKRQT